MTKKKKVRIPKDLLTEIVLFGKVFKIEYITDIDKAVYGESNSVERIIKVNLNRTESTWKATLIHEAMHAGLGITGRSETMTEDEEEGLAILVENLFEDHINFNE